MSSSLIIHGIRIDNDPRRGRDAEVWGMARGNVRYWNGAFDGWAAWFDVHSFEPLGLWPGLKADREQTIDWYRREPANGRPIFLIEPHDSIPASRPFPLETVMMGHALSEDGTDTLTGCRMFGCTADYLMAAALCRENLSEIILNGIGHSTDAGHRYVHRTLLYWIGLARGMGIRVTIDKPIDGFAADRPLSCYSNDRKLYGYETYGYEELDEIVRFFSPTVPDDDPDLAMLRNLSKDWRIHARPSSLFYADELDHLLAALQRRARMRHIPA